MRSEPAIRIRPIQSTLEDRHDLNALLDAQKLELRSTFDARRKEAKGKTVDAGLVNAMVSEKQARGKKLVRLWDSFTKGKAFGHIAYIVHPAEGMHKQAWREPVGFILSHLEPQAPTQEHMQEFKQKFDLAGLSQEELAKKVLFGEMMYVVPEKRKTGVATRLHELHEDDAPEGFTHRITTVRPEQKAAVAFLEKRGYVRIATRESGVYVMAKQLARAKTSK